MIGLLILLNFSLGLMLSLGALTSPSHGGLFVLAWSILVVWSGGFILLATARNFRRKAWPIGRLILWVVIEVFVIPLVAFNGYVFLDNIFLGSNINH